ncbi:MAG: hypothetical protein GQ546_00605, partial [Gammaproteobacteria bacterium]|nr:hypothetical protein [Gammaproteobacteria bacterium]
RAFQAMDKINNLKLPSDISEDIHSLFNLVGIRKKDNDGLLKRNKFINKSMGKLFRKKENVDTSDIEVFIINTAKKRYKSAMRNQLH